MGKLGKTTIIIFTYGYIPIGIYGVARHVERLTKYLLKQGLNIVIITKGERDLPCCEEDETGALIIRTPSAGISFKDEKFKGAMGVFIYTLFSCLFSLKIVKKRNVLLLHGNGSYYGGWQAALAAFLTKRPFTVTIHGAGIDYYRHLRKPPLVLRFLKWAKAVIVQKESAIPILKRWGIPEERIFYVEEGAIDTEWFRPPLKDFKRERAPQIAFVGRLIRFKDPLLLVEAAPLILKRFPEARFVFAGDGYLRPEIERRARNLGIGDKVMLLGEVLDVRKVYWSSNVFVALSPYNNFSDLAMLEAMACGLPVVATNSGETYKIIRHGWNGLLVRPRDSRDLADKVMAVLENPALAKKLGQNARRTVLERYDLRLFGHRMLAVFLKVIREAQGLV